MRRRQPVTSRRLAAVMTPTIVAVAATAVVLGPRCPFAAFLFIAGIACVSAAALPSPAWAWWMQMAGRAVPHQVRKLPRGAVILTVCIAVCIAVDALVFPRSIPAGVALAGLLLAACCAAIWSPEWAWLADWRERALTERWWNRRLKAMDAHDRKNFSGKGIPRKDWARFLDELAGVLREMRSSEERES